MFRPLIERQDQRRMPALVAGPGQDLAVPRGEECQEIIQVGADGRAVSPGELALERRIADALGQDAGPVFVHESRTLAVGIAAFLQVAVGGVPRGVVRAPCLVKVMESGQFGAHRCSGVAVGRNFAVDGEGSPLFSPGRSVTVAEEIAEGVFGVELRVRVGDFVVRVRDAIGIVREDHVAHVIVRPAVQSEEVVGLLGDERP